MLHPRSAYAASKHALHGFFDSLRAEVTDRGIEVTCLVPGFIRTPLADHALNGAGQPYGKNIRVNDSGMTADRCAQRMVRAMARRREEALVGGFEMTSVWLNRYFPSLLRRLIRNRPLQRLRLQSR